MTDSQVQETVQFTPGASSPAPTVTVAALPFPLVGLVGGAGSRQALEAFFRNLPADCGIAFVVVTRLAAKEHQHVVEAINARTNMPVVTAADGAAVQIDQIYLAPPGVQLTIEQGVFRLHNFTRERAQGHRCLDPFLTSLAQAQGENAVAILLSGTGEDGVAGLQQVKAHGGLVLVQEPNEAAHPALPRRALAGAVDFSGGAGELARYLVQVKGDLATGVAADRHAQDAGQLLVAILTQIATHTGHDLSHYKFSTLQRRIARRLQLIGVSELTQYLSFLQDTPEEAKRLFRDCLVSVTSFFRDPDAYAMLERDCIPQLFLNKGRNDFVRVWIAGCATGEEAYSVAIQLLERAAQVAEAPRLQIFATDIDEEAIAVARRGFYPAAIAKQITGARLQRYFSEENGGYRVKPEVRERVLFAVHDLLKDPPFTRLDFIACRNVLIYFNRDAQEKVFDIFHYALQREPPGCGYLFLGTSESVDAANELFTVLNKHCHLYQRRDVVSTAQRRAPLTTAALKGVGEKVSGRSARIQSTKVRTVEEMYTAWTLRVHAPPRLLVNDNYDITHLFGGADFYLQERDGAITQNVLQKILPDLRLDLRAALYQAFNKGERTVSRLLRIERGEQIQLLQLHVGPVMEPGFPQEYVEVVFVTQEDAALLGLPPTDELTDLSLVARLEEELLRTRERLQSVIEEYELSGQELKTSNEELQSMNEELKSTTEELETSKEELQSMNEELITVNGELTRKIDELHRANSDLLNLIASTDVGAIFLDNNLAIKRFTPRATDLFNLISGDIGRPFAHVTHRLRHTGLVALAAHVRATAAHMEETVQRDDDRWFMLRAFPYRTVTGELDGVVITFVDINDLKRAESEERQRRQQQCLVELSRQALTGGDLANLLTTTTQRVAEVLDMELCKVLELQPDGETLLLKAGVGWNEGLVGHATITANVSLQAGYTLQFQTPVIVRDLRTETRFRSPDMLADHEVRSGMSVTISTPEATGNYAYGVLSVHSRQLRAFATYDVDFLQSVANLLATTIMRRRTEAALREQERRYHFIFESAGVSIWEEDFTSVKALLDHLKKQGVDDLRAYLAAHPEVVRHAFTLVKVRDVNRHTLTLFGADRKEQLLAAPHQIFLPETEAVFAEELIALAEGRHYYEAETTLQTLQGERRHVLFTMTFPTDARKLERVLVSILDITKRKEDEQDLHFLAEVAEQIRLATAVDQLVTGVVQTIGDYLQVDRAMFIEVDPAQDVGLVLGQHCRHLPPTAARYRLSDYSQVNRRELEAGHTLVCMDAEHDPRTAAFYKTVYEPEHERAFVGVPLLREGQWCGILSVTSATVRAWQPRTVALLETVAERTWLAVETLRLNAQLQRYADMLRLSYDAILVWTPAQGIEFWNHGAEALYGYTAAEALGQFTHHLLQTAYGQPWSTIMAQLEQNGAWEGEVIHTTKAGAKVVVSTRHQLIVDATGTRVVVEINRNITERKESEAILARYQLLSNQARDIMLFMRLDGQLIEANAAAAEAYGYDRATLLQMKIQDLRDPATHALITDQMVEADQAATGRGIRFETIHRRQDGSTFPVEVSSIGANVGAERLLLSVIRDISERKAAERAHQASAAQLQMITDNVSGLISYVDRAQRYRFVNAVYEAWFGQPRTYFLGRTVQETLGEAAYGVAHPHLRQVLAGQRITFENTIPYPDGITRTVLTTYVPDVADDGQVLGFYALVTDITERKHAEERLRFLAEASRILASSLDYPVTLENVAHTAVPGIADWCTIDLVDEKGAFQECIIAHVDPEKVRWAEELRARYPLDPNAPVGAPQVIRSGQAELYSDISDAMLQAVAKSAAELQLLRTVGYRSVMIAPLKTHGRILGAITFVATESERHFTAADLTMAEELAQRAAAAIGNAQLYQAVRQREQQLRISEERLRLATEAGRIGIYDHDLLTQQTTYSDLYRAITGITPNEQVTRTAWLARVHPADRALVEEKLQRAVAAGESYDYEYRIYRPDGELRWLTVSSRVSLDESGRAVRLTGALHDITERKQAEEEIQRLNRDLKRRLDELQSLLDVAPIGIFVAHDPLCEVITGNAVGAKLLGMPTSSNLSKSSESSDTLPFRVLQNGRELGPSELPMQYAVLHDTPVNNWEVDVVHADGTVVNLYEYATPLHDEEGKVRGCLGVFVDITERKQAEASLRESEERFRSAFEQAAVGMAHVSLDGRYLRVNDRLCTILGYPRAELLQKSFVELTHPDDLPTSLRLSDNLLSGKIPSYSTEKRYLRRDGSLMWVNITASVVRTADNQIKHRLVVIEDVSARKAAELALRELTATLDQRVKERTAELERSNRELDQFAYVASHDLKAPLRAIVNLAGWIAEDAGDRLPTPSKEHLEKLRGRALRMERLLDDLLTYSRVGRRDGVAEEVKTEALIQDTVYLLAPPADFQVRVEPELPALFTPRTPLELVFRNLISNAIKHHHQPEQGLVQITARDLGDFVEFEVRDNGPGIEPQYHERIFGMFQTLRPRDEVEGSGMGLAIAKRAVEYRGGAIQIESAVGAGTSFRFTWPKRTTKSKSSES